MLLQKALDALAFVLLRAFCLQVCSLPSPSSRGVPITPATWAGSPRTLGQDFPLHDLTVLLSGCSRGLAPANMVMWLWEVLKGSNCGRQEKHSIFVPFALGWGFGAH